MHSNPTAKFDTDEFRTAKRRSLATGPPGGNCGETIVRHAQFEMSSDQMRSNRSFDGLSTLF